MIKGDLFRWSYNDQEYEKRKLERESGTLYWCCARIFRFNGKKLVDIYSSYNATTYTEDVAEQCLDLIYLGNENDLEKTSIPEYYDDKDIVNLNHPNSSKGNIYVNKSAKRSKQAMISYASRKLEKAEHDKSWAISQIEFMNNKLKEIDDAENLDDIWI